MRAAPDAAGLLGPASSYKKIVRVRQPSSLLYVREKDAAADGPSENAKPTVAAPAASPFGEQSNPKEPNGQATNKDESLTKGPDPTSHAKATPTNDAPTIQSTVSEANKAATKTLADSKSASVPPPEKSSSPNEAEKASSSVASEGGASSRNTQAPSKAEIKSIPTHTGESSDKPTKSSSIPSLSPSTPASDKGNDTVPKSSSTLSSGPPKATQSRGASSDVASGPVKSTASHAQPGSDSGTSVSLSAKETKTSSPSLLVQSSSPSSSRRFGASFTPSASNPATLPSASNGTSQGKPSKSSLFIPTTVPTTASSIPVSSKGPSRAASGVLGSFSASGSPSLSVPSQAISSSVPKSTQGPSQVSASVSAIPSSVTRPGGGLLSGKLPVGVSDLGPVLTPVVGPVGSLFSSAENLLPSSLLQLPPSVVTSAVSALQTAIPSVIASDILAPMVSEVNTADIPVTSNVQSIFDPAVSQVTSAGAPILDTFPSAGAPILTPNPITSALVAPVTPITGPILNITSNPNPPVIVPSAGNAIPDPAVTTTLLEVDPFSSQGDSQSQSGFDVKLANTQATPAPSPTTKVATGATAEAALTSVSSNGGNASPNPIGGGGLTGTTKPTFEPSSAPAPTGSGTSDNERHNGPGIFASMTKGQVAGTSVGLAALSLLGLLVLYLGWRYWKQRRRNSSQYDDLEKSIKSSKSSRRKTGGTIMSFVGGGPTSPRETDAPSMTFTGAPVIDTQFSSSHMSFDMLAPEIRGVDSANSPMRSAFANAAALPPLQPVRNGLNGAIVPESPMSKRESQFSHLSPVPLDRYTGPVVLGSPSQSRAASPYGYAPSFVEPDYASQTIDMGAHYYPQQDVPQTPVEDPFVDHHEPTDPFADPYRPETFYHEDAGVSLAGGPLTDPNRPPSYH